MTTTLTTTNRTPTGDSSQRAGGWAALGQAGTFVVGMILYATVVAAADYGSAGIDPAEQVAFLDENSLLLNLWYSVIYLAFGALLVVQSLALYVRLRPSFMALVGTAFGLIWATLMFAVGMTAMVGNTMVLEVAEGDPSLAASLWSTVNLLIEGAGGGIELVGALWVGLISLAGLRTGRLPRKLSQLGLVVGVAGILTTSMLLTDVLTATFGLGIIAWYVWIGVALLRDSASAK